VRQRPFQMNAGDSFSTSCYFDAENATTFGKGATEEMCLFNMLYYPAKRLLGGLQWICAYGVPFEACNANLTSDQYSLTAAKTLSSLDIDNFFERDFGSSSISSGDGQCLPQPSIVVTTTSSAFLVHTMNTLIVVLLSATSIWQIYELVG
jgi:Copper type II ascorbate-dependent monooxygenase, C-terminal domain